jgi:pimeloyl-ACP methyl ester carboxylesterase
MVGLVSALGEKQAVIVGHDWGAPAAWTAALLRPEVFRAVVGMSVPYSPPGPVDLLTALQQMGVQNFYMQYFQQPGVAEAELQADVAATMRRITFSLSGDGAGGVAGMLPVGKGFLHNTVDPAVMPPWVNAEDLAYAVAEFRRTGFRGGLNWYRSLRLSWELLAPWRGAVIHQPSWSGSWPSLTGRSGPSPGLSWSAMNSPSRPAGLEERNQHLSQALEAHHWNVSLAARALGITRDTLRYRMVKHGLQRGANPETPDCVVEMGV